MESDDAPGKAYGLIIAVREIKNRLDKFVEFRARCLTLCEREVWLLDNLKL